MLRLYSPDSQPGSAVSPLMHTDAVLENTQLIISCIAEPVAGTLCFSVEGSDYIWIGMHYWKLVLVGFVLVLAALYITWLKQRTGKVSYIVGALQAVQNYRFLIRQLVSRDFKTKYKRSVLGMFWSFLNPLLMMCVQYFIFSTLFESDIPNYAAYLLIGIVCFNFFSEVCNMSLFSILGRCLLTKEIFPILENLEPGAGGEIQLTDAIKVMARDSGVIGVDFIGKRYDLGSKFGIMQAAVETALKHSEIGEEFKKYIKDIAATI